jgi:hypothetical protein
MEIKTKDGFKVEVEDGKIEIKTNNGKSGDDDDDSDDDKNKGRGKDDRRTEDP